MGITVCEDDRGEDPNSALPPGHCEEAPGATEEERYRASVPPRATFQVGTENSQGQTFALSTE